MTPLSWLVVLCLFLVGCGGPVPDKDNDDFVFYTFMTGRVYHFEHNGNDCYVSSNGISCVKKTEGK